MFRLLCFVLLLTPTLALSQVYIDEMTSTEVGDALQNGVNTVIIPTGGTEQNGAHMVLGKHNIRVHHLSGLIAEELGQTLVAPVIAYVPQGDIDPPHGHMRFTGTLSVPPEVFALTVEYAARSLYQAGFRHIVLLGDSGGNQETLAFVANKLNGIWTGNPLIYADAYYTTNTEFSAWIRSEAGHEEPGEHAGIADTSLQMAIAPHSIRPDRMQPHEGVPISPQGASAEMGQIGIGMFVQNTVAQIRRETHH